MDGRNKKRNENRNKNVNHSALKCVSQWRLAFFCLGGLVVVIIPKEKFELSPCFVAKQVLLAIYCMFCVCVSVFVCFSVFLFINVTVLSESLCVYMCVSVFVCLCLVCRSHCNPKIRLMR